MTTQSCRCDSPGYCSILQKNQTFKLWNICRGEGVTEKQRATYFDNWLRLAETKNLVKTNPKAILDLYEIPSDLQTSIVIECENRGMLLGDFIALISRKLNIPPCQSCKTRQEWLNNAHSWIRNWISSS